MVTFNRPVGMALSVGTQLVIPFRLTRGRIVLRTLPNSVRTFGLEALFVGPDGYRCQMWSVRGEL